MGFTFDGGKYDIKELPDVHKADITDILKQGHERIVLNTSKGTVVMKHITHRMKLRIDQIKYIRFPRAFELEQEAAILYPLASAEGADESAVIRAYHLAAELAPIMDIYAIGCIEYPFLTTTEDMDRFIQSLQPDEQEAIRQILVVLTDWSTPVDYSKLEIAERFHIQLVQMEHITEPTYMQYLALMNVINQEHSLTEEMYTKMGVLK